MKVTIFLLFKNKLNLITAILLVKVKIVPNWDQLNRTFNNAFECGDNSAFADIIYQFKIGAPITIENCKNLKSNCLVCDDDSDNSTISVKGNPN